MAQHMAVQLALQILWQFFVQDVGQEIFLSMLFAKNNIFGLTSNPDFYICGLHLGWSSKFQYR